MASGYAQGVLHSTSKSSHSHSKRTRTLDGKNGALSRSDVQAQNVKAARVYVFGDGNLAEDDEDEITEFEMRPRHKNVFESPKEDSKPIYFEKEISEGDTLQAIALKYACNVSELKRLNNLIQDREFFALKVVKVPMKRHGILSEMSARKDVQGGQVGANSRVSNGSILLSEDEQDDRSGLYSECESQHDFSDPETQMKVLRTLSIRENFSSQGKEAQKFLNKMDADLSRLKVSRPERESLTEVISVLTNKSIRPFSNSSKETRYNGADCGISWYSIFIITLCVAILVPLLYLFYYFVLKS